jgi:hypothetical protein
MTVQFIVDGLIKEVMLIVSLVLMLMLFMLKTASSAIVSEVDAKSRMARMLGRKAGSVIYAQRKAIVEPVNGQIEETKGLRRFLLRGLENG